MNEQSIEERIDQAMKDPSVCRKCYGCGQVADSEDGEPWLEWEALPPGADLAVRLGVVKPITCPRCNGTGKKA